MDDLGKTKKQLASELAQLRQRIAELEASEYRHLFEATRDGILILDAGTGEITAVNAFLTDLLGHSQEEVLGKKLWELGPFGDIETSKIAFHELQSKEYVRYEDVPLETKDRRSIAVEFVSSHVHLADRKKVIHCNIRDITDRKQADEQLRLQSAALHALWDTILSGQVWRGEIVNRRTDDSLHAEEHAIAPSPDAQGEISRFIAAGQDITERKRADEEILQRARLLALGAVVGLSLAHTGSLARALQQCAEALVTHLGAALARIWTLNERENLLELQASAGLYTLVNSPHGGKVPLGEFTIGRVAQDRKPYLTNTVIGDPHVSDQDWARREGMVAFAGHPLIVDDRVVGVVALFARHALSDDVISALASVADHLALGIERHRSADALRIAEERMRFALQNANVGIWDLDYTTGVLRWSDTIEAQYGLQPGTFGGTFETFVERIHPDDRASVVETVGRAMKSGADFSILNRAIWPDGTVRWLSGAGRIHLGEHGEPVRGVGISQDVTERKRAEGALGQSETRKAAILDSVLDCIVTMDADGMVIEFNAAAERTLGYTKAEAIGRALADLIIPPRLRAAHAAGLARYLATGEGTLIGKLIEITAVRSDGSEIPVELAITAMRSDKAPIFTGVLRDVTARKQADETRARLAAIVDSSDDAIYSTALDDTILTWNAGAERLYGYTRAEVVGRNRALIVPAGKIAELTAIVEKAARGEEGKPLETQRTRKDGSMIDISLRISPMTDPTGRITGASTVARDITSRKKAEAELRRLNDEIQRQRLRVFKATIRTVQDIVNNLLNSFQLARLEAEGRLPAEMLTLVDRMIQEAAAKLKTLGDLETVNEKEMGIGTGIDYPGSAS